MNSRLLALFFISLTIASVGLLGCPPPQVNVTVPNLVDMTEVAAVGALGLGGLSLGTVDEDFSNTIPEGRVMEQDPAAGTRVAQGSAVDMVISLGPEEQAQTTVPDLTGMTEVAAEGALGLAGLSVGTVYEEFSDTIPEGCVIEQLPLAGALVAQGTPVDLVISLGPEEQAQTTETILLPGGVPLEMVWIPGGTYLMGRYPGELDSYAYEDPQHTVTVPGFWMAKYELTKRQWQTVMGTTPWSGHSYVLSDLDSPAVYVSWNDAKAFITALNSYTGKTFRLPSEAEWEYACRAGTATRFYWGDDPSYTVGNAYCWWYYNAWNVGEQYAHVVGQKLPNAFGLYDMSGNVWEWCEDDYHRSYTGAPTNGSAWVDSPRGSYRVLRGGGWWSYGDGSYCRSASRSSGGPSEAGGYVGFRLSR